MSIKIKNIWWVGLILVVTAFIIAKSFDLATPYFWDELGVYAPGSLLMKDKGTIGILPGNLDPFFSRGHPLFCFFMHASFFKLFGDSVIWGHIPALLTGCGTLIAGYFFAKSAFNQKAALLFTIILAIHPLFYAMSGVIAPENQLTLFTVLALWAVVKEKWLWYILFGSCCILTKESGLVIPAAVLLFLLFRSVQRRDFFTWKRFRLFIYGGIPLLVFGAFLLIQKAQNGWYLFPMHVGMIKLEWYDFHYILDRMFNELFINEGRWLVGVPAMMYVAYRRFFPDARQETNDAVLVITLFIMLAHIFTSTNFYLPRYPMYIVPFVAMLGAQAFVSFVAFLKRSVVQGAVTIAYTAAVVILSVMNYYHDEFRDTTDMGYKNLVFCVRDCIRWSEKQPWHHTLVDANFPIFQGLDDKRNGYLTTAVWPHSDHYETDTIKHAMLFHFEPELPGAPRGRKYRVLKKFDRSYAHITVIEYD